MIQELLAKVTQLRAELDERHGDAWPADATEAFERAVAELNHALEAQEKKLALAAQQEALTQRAQALAQRVIPPAATQATHAATMPHETPAAPPWGEALRAYALGGPAAMQAEWRALYLRAAGPGQTGEAFVLPEETQREIVQARRRVGVIRSLATTRTTSAQVYHVPFVLPSGEFPSGQISENWPGPQAYTQQLGGLANPVVEQYLDRYTIPVDWYVPSTVLLKRDLLTDASVDLEALVRDLLTRTEAASEDKAFIRGSGAKEPLGLLTDTTLSDVNTGSATGLTYDGLVSVFTSLREEYASNATWLFHPQAIGQLLKLKDSQNRPLFVPGQTVMSLFDRPIRTSFFLDAPASNAYIGIFGDFSEYYIVDRVPSMLQRLQELYAPHVALLSVSWKGGRAVQREAFVRIKQAA